jgi:hypothetical protein
MTWGATCGRPRRGTSITSDAELRVQNSPGYQHLLCNVRAGVAGVFVSRAAIAALLISVIAIAP